MVVIADDVDGMDVLFDMDGHPVAANNVRIQRHKLRVDTRKWIVSKLLPMTWTAATFSTIWTAKRATAVFRRPPHTKRRDFL